MQGGAADHHAKGAFEVARRAGGDLQLRGEGADFARPPARDGERGTPGQAHQLGRGLLKGTVGIAQRDPDAHPLARLGHPVAVAVSFVQDLIGVQEDRQPRLRLQGARQVEPAGTEGKRAAVAQRGLAGERRAGEETGEHAFGRQLGMPGEQQGRGAGYVRGRHGRAARPDVELVLAGQVTGAGQRRAGAPHGDDVAARRREVHPAPPVGEVDAAVAAHRGPDTDHVRV
jgi:hypothetical protein